MDKPYQSIHPKAEIERQLDNAEALHYEDRYMQGVVDALLWVLGRTPAPTDD